MPTRPWTKSFRARPTLSSPDFVTGTSPYPRIGAEPASSPEDEITRPGTEALYPQPATGARTRGRAVLPLVLVTMAILAFALFTFQSSESSERFADATIESPVHSPTDGTVTDEAGEMVAFSQGDDENQSPIIERNQLNTGANGPIIKTTSADGAGVNADILFGRMTDEFRSHLLGPRLLGPNLWKNAILARNEAGTGELNLNGIVQISEQDFLLIFAVGFVPKLIRATDFPAASKEGVISFVLQLTAPITIHIRGEDAVPIAGGKAFLWYEPTTDEGWIAGDSHAWTRLRLQFFLDEVAIDAAGDGIFLSTFPEANRLEIRPGSNHVSEGRVGIPAGTEITLEPDLGLTLVGKVVDSVGNPLNQVALTVYSNRIQAEQRAMSRLNETDGTFLLEGLPALGERLILMASRDGFANTSTNWTTTSPGSVLDATIVMSNGVGGSLHFESSWGENVGPGLVWLGCLEEDGLTFATEVEENGTAVLERHFLANTAYACTIRLGGITQTLPTRILLEALTSAEASAEVEILVPRLATFAAWESDQVEATQFEQVRWVPRDLAFSGSASWSLATASPWLPAGPGSMEFVTQEGEIIVEQRTLVEGPNQVLRAPAARDAILAFALPNNDPEAWWEVWSNDSMFLATGDSSQPAVRFSCTPGTYRLIYGNAENVIDRPDIQVPLAGIDLGVLDPSLPLGGDIYGYILHADGTPWIGYPVAAMFASDSTSLGIETDADGSFYLQGLPVGVLTLVGRGESVFGIPGIDFSMEVSVEPGLAKEPIIITIERNAQLLGHVDLNVARTVQAFLLDGVLSISRVNANGGFRLPIPERTGLVGITAASAHELLVVVAEIDAGREQIHLAKSGVAREFIIQNATGEALGGIQVRPRLQGQLLPSWAISDSRGRISLEYESVSELEFLFMADGRLLALLPALDLSSSSSIKLMQNSSIRTMTFPDGDGKPRLDVTVLGPHRLGRFFPDVAGIVSVPEFISGNYTVVSPRTFPVQVAANISGAVDLPSRLRNFVVQAAPVVVEIRYRATSDMLSTLVVQGGVRRDEEGIFRLPDFPSGELEIEAISAAGRLISVKTLNVHLGSSRVIQME